jgi:hypothetical protein
MFREGERKNFVPKMHIHPAAESVFSLRFEHKTDFRWAKARQQMHRHGLELKRPFHVGLRWKEGDAKVGLGMGQRNDAEELGEFREGDKRRNREGNIRKVDPLKSSASSTPTAFKTPQLQVKDKKVILGTHYKSVIQIE